MALPSFILGLSISVGLVAAQHLPLADFQSPPKTYRTKFRYWFHDASIEASELAKDIESISVVGGGGIELIPFHNYGFGHPSFPPLDEFGVGTPAFNDLFKSALGSARDSGLTLDFALNANQGQGVAAEPLTPGLAKQLVYGEITVDGGDVFQGEIPTPNLDYNFGLSGLAEFMHGHENWGPSKLVAVVAGGVKSSTPFEDPQEPEYPFYDIALDEASLVDLTDSVTDGKLTWEAPSDYEAYTLFAVYERFTNQRSLDPSPNAVEMIGNGSWITDHFSAAGANLVINFWEDHVLDDETRELLKNVGEYAWEDSMEMSSALWWSHEFLERFEASRGYSPRKYLPLMFHQSNTLRAEYRPYNNTYMLDDDLELPGQNKYLQDYRLTLNEGYREYLTAIEEWAQSLSMEFSVQPAYNLPLDMAASVPVVGGPEAESLAFPDIDLYSQFTGAAHISGRNIISSEVGATMAGAYSLSVRELLALFKESFAAGVNAVVVHGMSYGGEFSSTWPGYTPAGFAFGDSWGRKRSDWKYADDIMEYTARSQLVLQTGRPRRDVAFYRYDEPWAVESGYGSEDLRAKGYSYEYLASANLASDYSVVADGILAPEGPAYRALVFNNQSFISGEAASKTLEFADNGLPIFVIGSFPNATIGSLDADIVSDVATVLAEHESVTFVSESETLSEILAREAVKPRVSLTAGGSDLYSFWRAAESEDFVFLYNRGSKDVFELTFEAGDRVPYRLDAWTGEQTEVVVYERSEGGISFTVELSEQQTAVFAFVAPGDSGEIHVVSHSENVDTVKRGQNGGFVAYLTDENKASLTLSNSDKIEIDGSNCSTEHHSPITLGPWDLTIESWVPGPDENNSSSVVETLELGSQADLTDWTQINGLEEVSGVGIYTTVFTPPKDVFQDAQSAAMLINFGPVLNTLRAWVNDNQLPPVDTANAEVDISEFLSEGTNSIRVEVASSLFNAVKARKDWVQSLGQPPQFPEAYDVEPHPFGLVGPVTIRRLRRVLVE